MKQSTHRIFSKLDLVLVKNEIRKTPLMEYDYDVVASMIVRAADTWLLKDLQEYDLCNVELKGIHEGFSFVFDIVLGSSTTFKSKVVDWKTGSVDRPNYDVETKWSDQTSIYLSTGLGWLKENYGVEPSLLEYRCLGYGPEGKAKLITALKEEIHEDDATRQKDAIQASYFAMYYHDVWPRNRPSACRRGDSYCPFVADCNKMVMPRGFDPKRYHGAVPRSKSDFKSYLECPEKYRRTKVLEHQGEETPQPIAFGEAFHAGVASIWQQAFEKRGEIL